MNAWRMDQTKILTRSEIAEVLADIKRRAKRTLNPKQSLIVFRLATCCGLRASEISGLKLQDVRVGVRRPYINIPKRIAKRKRPRRVPLWWDAGTLADIEAWKEFRRRQQKAKPTDYFVCTQSKNRYGHPIHPLNLRLRFISNCRVLGPERQKHLTIHHGRHSFCSHALAAGRSLAEVRDAAGHANIATTSVYAHVAVEDDGTIGNIFDFQPQ